ncbi:MAG: hypothetical protein ACFFCB_04200 [Candidatus Odinarchaeota archaeon]
MSNRLLINDTWVLERAGYASSSFSTFLKGVTGGKDLSMKIQRGIDIAKSLTTKKGQEKMGIPSFVQPMISDILGTLGDKIEPLVKGKIDAKLAKAEQEVQAKIEAAQKKQQKALEEAQKKREKKLSKLDERLAQLDIELDQMGDTIGQNIASKLFGPNTDSLAKALIEATKEQGVTNEGVLNLIHMLPEFEALMYFMNVRKFYRDHTAHSLRVAVLCDYIFSKTGASGGLRGILEESLDFNPEEAEMTWWLAGLLHDIGTPLAKLVTSVNWSLVNEMLRCYPSVDMEVSPLRIDLSNPHLGNEAYLKILSKGLPQSWQTLIHNGLGRAELPKDVFVYTSGEQPPPLYEVKGPKMDHGVVAAVTLMRTLGSPDHVEKDLAEDRPLIEAARAIALHNFIPELGQISFEKYPLLFVLAVADELQEWGRPVPVTTEVGFFTTTLEKITLMDAIFHDSDSELWDIPYTREQAKKLARFDFKRLYNDKEKALSSLDCAEQFPESDLWLINYHEEKSSVENKFNIKIKTQ